MHGLAYIPLKEDAVPTRQCAYPMQGAKMEAYRKIVEDWLEAGFLERPTKLGIEWCSARFPVSKKKSETFPWRGVVDVRGPTSQTRKCNHTLPIIEEMLVKFGNVMSTQKWILDKHSINNLCMWIVGLLHALTRHLEFTNGR